MSRRDWTRDELLLVMRLYCRLPFGKFHSRNPDVIHLAEVIGRTASAVAMKLSNLASLDPAHQLRGVKGLSGASEGDRRIWAEFHADWERLGVESELVWKAKADASNERLAVSDELEEGVEEVVEEVAVDAVFAGETEAARMVRVRLAQRFFRRAVLASYEARCCVSDVAVPSLLVASHILPWGRYPRERANPRNGLCLSRLHDGAFDRGLMTFDEEFRLVLSGELRAALSNRVLAESFQAFEGKPMRLPERFRPDEATLAWHRETMFRG